MACRVSNWCVCNPCMLRGAKGVSLQHAWRSFTVHDGAISAFQLRAGLLRQGFVRV